MKSITIEFMINLPEKEILNLTGQDRRTIVQVLQPQPLIVKYIFKKHLLRDLVTVDAFKFLLQKAGYTEDKHYIIKEVL